MEHHKRHVVVWKIIRPLMALLVRFKFHFTAVPADVRGPFLFVSNHNTDWDPMLAGCSFREQMYFVTSEHLLRHGLGGKLVQWLQDPIPRQKGGSAADTVMSILRRLKKGYSVGLFPEGNRSWDGVTQDFPASTGKLARAGGAAGAALVTYRLDRAYLASPRWSGGSVRRGRVTGHVVNVYPPEALRAMTPGQITEHIREDLQEDVWSEQRNDPIPFRGSRLAEHMETLLFLCPKCGGIHTLHSRDNTIRCGKCGFGFRYLPTGFLEGEDLPWDNLRDGNRWQQGEIRRMCDEAGADPIFTDTEVAASDVIFSRGLRPVGKGRMRLFRDRLELPGVTVPLREITGIALKGPQDIYFGTAEHHYLVRSDEIRCMVKYLTACSWLNGADYGV